MLSPASVPSCSVRGDSSIAWAIDEAVPGVPIRTRMSPLRPTVTGMSASEPAEPLVRGRDPDREVLRRDVDVALAARDLDQAELGDVAAHGGLGHGEAAPAELLGELVLAADRGPGDDLADDPLAVVARPGRGPVAHRRGLRPPRPGAIGRRVSRVPNVGSSSARARASGAEASAMIASAPSQPSAARARPGPWGPCRRRSCRRR